MWKHLTHPNIVPLLGVTITPYQLISTWMSGGDLPGYIEKNPNADRLKLVGVPQLQLSRAHSVISYPTSLKAFTISTLVV